MNISSVSNAYLTSQTARLNAQIEKTSSFEAALEKAAKMRDDQELLYACEEFEGYFLQMMFREMRKTIDRSGRLIPVSNAENIFQDMLDEQVSISLAHNGRGVGLATAMYKQMKRNINAVSAANSEV